MLKNQNNNGFSKVLEIHPKTMKILQILKQPNDKNKKQNFVIKRIFADK
jgi:hypothetical protein